MPHHYVLLDACVPAAHFAPRSTRLTSLASRSTALLSGSSPDNQYRFLIANFCIAEVFSVFEKYRWGESWNSHVTSHNRLTQQQFMAARKGFGEMIHNGSKILQVELDRYHILCVDLLSPINNAYKISRKRKGKKTTQVVPPAKTYDMLVAAMSVWLAQQHGADNFTLVTGDRRLASVINRAKSISLNRSIKAHLTERATSLGLTYSPAIYPEVIDLGRASLTQLRARFPNWSESW